MVQLNPDAVLQFVDVTVRRGQKLLLDRINWTVEEDERWAILGPNGAGKTTLLQIAAATMHPTSGEAYVFGERLGGVDMFELRPRIGLASAALAQFQQATRNYAKRQLTWFRNQMPEAQTWAAQFSESLADETFSFIRNLVDPNRSTH